MPSTSKPDPNKQFTPKGTEIPVPKRSELYGNLEKVAKGSGRDGNRRPKK